MNTSLRILRPLLAACLLLAALLPLQAVKGQSLELRLDPGRVSHATGKAPGTNYPYWGGGFWDSFGSSTYGFDSTGKSDWRVMMDDGATLLDLQAGDEMPIANVVNGVADLRGQLWTT